MTAPKLYDISETALLVRMSTSWLYRAAGVTIPVTRIPGSRRLFWTDEQITQIIRDGAQPAKDKAPQKADQRGSVQRRGASPKVKLAKDGGATPGIKIPQARPERSRHYRPQSAA